MPGADQGEHVGRSLRRKHGPVRRCVQVREEEEDEEADEEGAQGVLIRTNDWYLVSQKLVRIGQILVLCEPMIGAFGQMCKDYLCI